jgi:hypothetical protein
MYTADYRFWNAVWGANTSSSTFDVRKMTANTSWIINNPTSLSKGQTRNTTRTYAYYAQNYIVYRLSDVMLMKAEALTQMATTNTGDTQLGQAFDLVQEVNSRSISLAADTLKYNTYASKASMRTLILQERLREFCFEGKRWYDLLRYNYQNVSGIDYSKTLYELSKENATFVSNSSDMLNLLIRKYTSGGNAISAKLRTEPYLYMPIPKTDIEINSLLRQNPVYSDDKEYEKNI